MGQGNKSLDGAERQLWQAAMRDAKPLKRGRRLAPAEKQADQDAPAKPPPSPRPATKTAAKVRPKATPRAPASAPTHDLGHGGSEGLDRRQAERFRRGQLEIEGRLDLHGKTQEEARRALDAFLTRAAEAGKRCVLVITGKGRPEGGVLRAEVPRWLNSPENRARIVSFDYAQQRHGGHGALYVLLKRRRTSKGSPRGNRPGNPRA